MAEKKYVVGYLYGREHVIWENVTNFSEDVNPDNGLDIITFIENGIQYVYEGNERRGFTERTNKSPFVTSLKLMGRRTAKRHDYLDPRKRYPSTNDENDLFPNTTSSRTHQDDYDDYIGREGRRVRLYNDSDYGGPCGGESEYREVSGCGGRTVYRRGACGGWTPVYGDGACGAVSTRPYYDGGCGYVGGGCGGGC